MKFLIIISIDKNLFCIRLVPGFIVQDDEIKEIESYGEKLNEMALPC